MKKAKIFSALLVSVLVVGFQGVLAQNTGDALDSDAEKIRRHRKLAAEKTQALMSDIISSKHAKILQNGESDELFLVNVGKASINIMKDTSNPEQTEFWYLVVSDKTVEAEEDMVIENANPELPEVFSLSPNYPNPFNPSTTIKFQLPEKNGTATVRTVLRVYDILGRLVRTIVDEDMSPGFYTKQWDGLNDNGVRISSGVYFYSIMAGDFRQTKKMLLIK